MIEARRRLMSVVIFGIAFGLLEAAIVIDLRAIYEPARKTLLPEAVPGDLFPLLTQPQLESRPDLMRLLRIELLRELATITMLASIAWTAARRSGEWLAWFSIAFGVWDIFFYVFLKLLAGWPSSLFTWDLLFLLPAPWYGPVIAPMLVAILLIGGGIAYLHFQLRIRLWHWASLVTANGLVLSAFLWDWRNLMSGGMPNPFPWPVFGVGLLLGAGTMIHARRGPA